MIGPSGFRRGQQIAQEREGHTMKLDIEALAREAGLPMAWVSETGVLKFSDLEALARLIVEKCAVECDHVYYQNIGPAHGEVRHGVASCSAAIRQLLEDK